MVIATPHGKLDQNMLKNLSIELLVEGGYTDSLTAE